MLMVDVLEEEGFTVLEAEDWDSAMAVLENLGQALALMVTDVGLRDAQERDGLALAGCARALRPGLPVLVASGYAGLDVPEGAQLISKPFSIDQLRDRVHAMLA
ncbi:response regulator [Pseudomonas sp. KNUC1026]|nr:response regulator [Pseudomonas sp. KNUC1026]